MPRKPAAKQKIATSVEEVDASAIERATAARTELDTHLRVVEGSFGDGQLFDAERSIRIARACFQAAADEILRGGRELIRLKEHLPHGEFQTVLVEQVGIDPRMARRFMAAAAKFSELKTLQSAQLARSHLLELATLDEDQLAELDAGGTVADLKLDDVERMSVSELRAALRKAKTKAERDEAVHEKQLKRKNDKIDELDRKLELASTRAPGWQSRAFDIAIETTTKAMTAIDAVHCLHTLRDAILTEDFGEDAESAITAVTNVYYDAVTQLQAQVQELAFACDDAFAGYKLTARPLAEMTDVFGPVEMPAEG